MCDQKINNKRIARNTVFLYFRTLFVLVISLYTSRAILQILGVNDFGIYQVVGGLVAMFSIISSSLSVSISRYITFEIGRGDIQKLRKIFCTSIVIQIIIALVILIISEFLATWFIDNEMQVPQNKIYATKWVLQFSLITFCVNLLSVPYNACLIAHERMKAFAFVSMIEVALKLGACYILLIIPFDRLIVYAANLMLISICIRFIYIWYCHKNFQECNGVFQFDREAFKDMISFSSWSFFTNSTSILNNQGITMLINTYFGLTVNAARGLATQVESAVMQFVGNFTTAINPQITKSYAAGELNDMYTLVCRGAKFSYFAMLMFSLPLILEMKTVLNMWLTTVPDHTVIFTQLTLIMGMCDCIGSSGFTACMATGKLQKYALIITPIGAMEFILTWIFFHFGASAVSTYYLYILIKTLVLIARMFLMKNMIGMPISRFIRDVFKPIIITSIVASIIPFIISSLTQDSFLRLIIITIMSIVTTGLSIFYLGLTIGERTKIQSLILSKIRK